ncbi:MAG: prepilin-type N-terminal cleavage/methylation domain-containing protein [Candidatus Doudnabacteria bacterium]|nr:prepilin-type N-terminal cleavage/methylation domain-containing protein [Candidatus Doudnabacteria bacterium]
MKPKIKTFFSFRSHQNKDESGFTLIETIAGIAIFAILIVGVLSSYAALSTSVRVAREKTVLSSLAANYLEIMRNLPYSEVGTVNGNPSGSLADASNPIGTTIESVQYEIYYEVTYIDDPADGTILLGTDSAPNDYKQVKMFIEKLSTGTTTHFLTTVSPKGLEGLSNAGAILIKVYDASGQPIEGAEVHIENTSLTPDIILDRTTDSTGQVIEVALPASVNGYSISATKAGYSTDSTYPITVANPNPVKPDSTVVDGTVTQVSLFIDLVADLTVQTVDATCSAIAGVNVNVRGSKLIGTSPDVYKYDEDLTSSASGQIALNNIEWDTYIPVLQTGEPYTIYGTSPIQQITALPATSQEFTFVLGAATTNSLRVIVKDASTSAALEGATVRLHKNSTGSDSYATTGGSIWQQLSWVGGGGQTTFSDITRYSSDDGNVDVATAPTGLRLRVLGSNYVPSASLESSTFDTGAASDFTTITWEPTSQVPGTEVKFQVASNNDNLTWNFIGPDGTAGTYYSTPGTTLHASHASTQYIRYKAFLSTTDDSITPVLSNVGINYVSGCNTPGQVIFPGLTADNDYELEISLTGYTTQTVDPLTISGNQAHEIFLSP